MFASGALLCCTLTKTRSQTVIQCDSYGERLSWTYYIKRNVISWREGSGVVFPVGWPLWRGVHAA